MAEYICREAILEDLEKEIEAGNIALDEDVWINKGLRIAIRDIKDIKAADVQSVHHGRWTDLNNDAIYHYECSCCKGHTDRHEKFCPNCGARMDGETNE